MLQASRSRSAAREERDCEVREPRGDVRISEASPSGARTIIKWPPPPWSPKLRSNDYASRKKDQKHRKSLRVCSRLPFRRSLLCTLLSTNLDTLTKNLDLDGRESSAGGRRQYQKSSLLLTRRDLHQVPFIPAFPPRHFGERARRGQLC